MATSTTRSHSQRKRPLTTSLQREEIIITDNRENMVFTIKKSKIKAWGYEITARNFHNIAPTAEAAVRYLQDRYGYNVHYRIAKD